jgi:hypothetical protein
MQERSQRSSPVPVRAVWCISSHEIGNLRLPYLIGRREDRRAEYVYQDFKSSRSLAVTILFRSSATQLGLPPTSAPINSITHGYTSQPPRGCT